METNRICLALDLKEDPALIAEYERYHNNDVVWPEIIEGNKACGILNMEIYRAGNRLFMIMETTNDFDIEKNFAKLSTMPRQKEWAQLMLGFQQRLAFAKSGEHWVAMKKIFTQS